MQEVLIRISLKCKRKPHAFLYFIIQDYFTKKITTWGRKPYTPTQDNVKYYYFEDEIDMLNSFLYHWSKNPPDVIVLKSILEEKEREIVAEEIETKLLFLEF